MGEENEIEFERDGRGPKGNWMEVGQVFVALARIVSSLDVILRTSAAAEMGGTETPRREKDDDHEGGDDAAAAIDTWSKSGRDAPHVSELLTRRLGDTPERRPWSCHNRPEEIFPEIYLTRDEGEDVQKKEDMWKSENAHKVPI